MTFDKSKLFEKSLPEQDVTIEGLGTFRVRALTRAESMAVGDTEGGTGAKERVIVSLGCVDPTLSIQEVKRWQEASLPGVMEPVVETIATLSGMLDGQSKEETARFPDGSDD